jgi:uncharacterized protein
MTKDTENNLLRFVDEMIHDSVKRLSINWFGGEPLVAFNRLVEISNRLRILAIQRGLIYDAGIVTNGFLLTHDKISILKENEISSIQITLDGPPRVHDNRRMLHDGGPSFFKILDNLIHICGEKYFSVVIRINIDNQTEEEIIELLSYLEKAGLKNAVGVSLGMVYNYADSRENIQRYLRYSDIEYSLMALLDKNGWKHAKNSFGGGKQSTIRAFCGADNYYSFVVSANGEIYKCWNEVSNNTLPLGNINSDRHRNPVFLNARTKYLLVDPENDEKCSQCSILPLCNNSCPYNRTHQLGVKDLDLCSQSIREVKRYAVGKYEGYHR